MESAIVCFSCSAPSCISDYIWTRSETRFPDYSPALFNASDGSSTKQRWKSPHMFSAYPLMNSLEFRLEEAEVLSCMAREKKISLTVQQLLEFWLACGTSSRLSCWRSSWGTCAKASSGSTRTSPNMNRSTGSSKLARFSSLV